MIEPFLKKQDIRTNYFAELAMNHPDPCVKAMAAIMCELQSDNKNGIPANVIIYQNGKIAVSSLFEGELENKIIELLK